MSRKVVRHGRCISVIAIAGLNPLNVAEGRQTAFRGAPLCSGLNPLNVAEGRQTVCLNPICQRLLKKHISSMTYKIFE